MSSWAHVHPSCVFGMCCSPWICRQRPPSFPIWGRSLLKACARIAHLFGLCLSGLLHLVMLEEGPCLISYDSLSSPGFSRRLAILLILSKTQPGLLTKVRRLFLLTSRHVTGSSSSHLETRAVESDNADLYSPEEHTNTSWGVRGWCLAVVTKLRLAVRLGSWILKDRSSEAWDEMEKWPGVVRPSPCSASYVEL